MSCTETNMQIVLKGRREVAIFSHSSYRNPSLKGSFLQPRPQGLGFWIRFFRSCRDRSNSRHEGACTFDSIVAM
jgi:hypothetical protein